VPEALENRQLLIAHRLAKPNGPSSPGK